MTIKMSSTEEEILEAQIDVSAGFNFASRPTVQGGEALCVTFQTAAEPVTYSEDELKIRIKSHLKKPERYESPELEIKALRALQAKKSTPGA